MELYKFYNHMNWEALIFFKNYIIENTVSLFDEKDVNYEGNLDKYKAQIEDLFRKNILFFIKELFETDKEEFLDPTIIYNNNHFLDDDKDFLEFLGFQIYDVKFTTNAELTVKVDMPLLLEWHINNPKSGFHLITCDEYKDTTSYLLVPSLTYLEGNDELHKMVKNMTFSFSDTQNLKFVDNYDEYYKHFIMVNIKS